MNSRSFWRASCVVLALAAGAAQAAAPRWLRDAAAVQVPSQKEELDAIQLLSDVELEVLPDGMLRKRVRAAYRILRPSGQGWAVARAVYDHTTVVKDMQAWTIPARGGDLKTSFGDAADTTLNGVEGSELISDIRSKVLMPPSALPGSVVGYEYELEFTPLALADSFDFQTGVPVLEARYTLKIPRGWSITSTWVNHLPVAPVRADERNFQWTLRDLPAIEPEPFMPSPASIASRLQVAFAPAGATPQLGTWQGIGSWFVELAQDRLAPDDAIRAKVAELTQGKNTDVERLGALAAFVQAEIRYVAIELGIGGFQPHHVTDVLANRFGDCKDKASLLATMLREVGIDSMPVLVNTDRAMIAPDTPPGLLFNHVILAILLPREAVTSDLLAVTELADGRVMVFFDPTDEITPVGRLTGTQQDSYGLLSGPDGSRLVRLPQLDHRDSGMRRTGQLKLDPQGTLSGSFTELVTGDMASGMRYFLRTSPREADLIKPVESRLASSLAAFRVTNVETANRMSLGEPLEWRYSIVADAYARRAGELLMVRPRVLGSKAESIDDDGGSRRHDMLFTEARMDQDEVSIELPAGFVVESLPDPVDIDVGFAAYRSRTEVTGSELKFTRTYELRELRIPADQVAEFRRLNQAIARDERAVAVLKSTAAR